MIGGPPQPEKISETQAYQSFAYGILFDFIAAISAPVVVFAWAGNALDVARGTRPLFLLSGVALAALVSGTYIVRKAKKYGAHYNEIGRAYKAAREAKAKPESTSNPH